ncbi:transforming growth factor beta regulator 1-like isoform X2 [Oscarella lobularis]|uniref:transforming growth factor beta regulator 1-like isoform X2 n=1 Tax=Oscarella lobularis TaxID=121494 RepID=UPI0033142C6E
MAEAKVSLAYGAGARRAINPTDKDNEESANERPSSSSSNSSNEEESFCPEEGASNRPVVHNGLASAREEKYAKKCQYIKKIMKSFFYENNSLADELRKTNHAIVRLKAERRFLLDKLLHYQTGRTVPLTNVGRKKPRFAASSGLDHIKRLKKEKERIRAKAMESLAEERTEAMWKLQQVRSLSSKSDESKGAKRKRLKPGMVRRKLQPVPLDSEGYPVMPINLGGLTIHSLGRIVADRPGFHSERYIWPVGFVSTRTFFSMYQPGAKCVYRCRILDGKNSPLFEMQAADSPDRPIIAASATACHTTVLKQVNKTRSREATNTGSGPEFFGFSHPVVMNILQNDPLCEELEKFQRIEFNDPLGVQNARIRMPPASAATGAWNVSKTTTTTATATATIDDVRSGSDREMNDEESSGNEADSDGTGSSGDDEFDYGAAAPSETRPPMMMGYQAQ